MSTTRQLARVWFKVAALHGLCMWYLFLHLPAVLHSVPMCMLAGLAAAQQLQCGVMWVGLCGCIRVVGECCVFAVSTALDVVNVAVQQWFAGKE
jgi:hypothetical protein